MVALSLAIPSYYITYGMIYRYRMKHWGQLERPVDHEPEEG